MALPSDIAGLYGWYKADSFSLNDGDTCGTWSDASGNGRNLTASGTPQYKTNQLAGYPCVRYLVADSDYHTLASFGWLANLANCTIFAVFKSDGSGGAGSFIRGDTTLEGLGYDGSQVYMRAGSAGAYAYGGSLNAETWAYAYGCQNGSHAGCSLNGGSEITASASGRGVSGATGYVRPGVTATASVVTSAGGGWSAAGAAYPTNQNDGDDNTYQTIAGDTVGAMNNFYDTSNIPDNAVISSLSVGGNWGAGSAGATVQVKCWLGGVSTTLGTIGDVASYSYTVTRPGGGDWTKADVAAMYIEFNSLGTGNGNAIRHKSSALTVNYAADGVDLVEFFIFDSDLSAGDKGLMNAYLQAKYFNVVPQQNDRVRDVLSRRLWLLRRANGLYEVSVPLWALNADILDRVALESRMGPDPSGEGWKSKKWARRQFSVQRIDIEPGSMSAKLLLLDRRPLDIVMWDTGASNVSGVSAEDAARENGVARLLSPGNTRTYTRQSKAWVSNPADQTSCVEVSAGRPAISYDGELFEPERTNLVLRSAFVSGTTGLTLSGTGTNGSSIDTDDTDNFFNTESGAESLKFTAGNAHTADLRAAFPDTAEVDPDTVVTLSIDHKTDSGEPLNWRLALGGVRYYNASSEAWQDSAVDNALPTCSDRSPAARFSQTLTVEEAPATSPDDISGLTLWLKADTGVYSDAGTTPATDTGTVYQWNDQSGNGFHMTQPTSTNRPTYRTSFVNGQPAIRFDGVDNEMNTAAGSVDSILSTTQGTVFVVAYVVTVTGAGANTYNNDVVFCDPNSAPGVRNCIGLRTTPNVAAFHYDGSEDNATLSVSGAGAWKTFLFMRGSGNVYLGISDARDASLASAATGTTGALANRVFRIGSNFDRSFYTEIDIAEIVAYNVALSEDDRKSIESYLANKYGITLPYSAPANQSLSLSVALPSGGTASRVSHLYHAQIEAGPFPTSQIITDSAEATRVAPSLTYESTEDSPLWDPALGTFYCEFIPDFNSDDVGDTINPVFVQLYDGGTNYDTVFYYDGNLYFGRETSGGSYSAVVPATLARGTLYKIAARWTGPDGELGLAPYTMDVFLDGVKGTSDVSEAPDFSYPATITIGSDNNGGNDDMAAGVVRNRRIYPYALTDEEIANMEVSG